MGVISKLGGIGESIDCTKFSSTDKLLRAISYISRFINNVKFRIGKSEVILNDELSADEIKANYLVKIRTKFSSC